MQRRPSVYVREEACKHDAPAVSQRTEDIEQGSGYCANHIITFGQQHVLSQSRDTLGFRLTDRRQPGSQS